MDNQNMNDQSMNNQSMNDQNVNNQNTFDQGMNNQNMNQNMNYQGAKPAKEKLVAGLLAIFLGSLGIHKFYLGYTTEAVIMLVVTLAAGIFTLGAASGIMAIIALVEGIIYLTKSDDEFQQIYVYNHKGWF